MLLFSLFVYVYNFILAFLTNKLSKGSIFILYFPYLVFLILFGWFNLGDLDKDYYVYYNWFEYIRWNDVSFFHDKDPLFQYISINLLSFFSDINYVFLFFVTISIFLKYLIGIKFVEKELLWLYLIFVYSRFYILHDLTQIRASLAISLCMLGSYFFFRNKNSYWLFFVSAFFIHQSTIVFILLMILLRFISLYRYKFINIFALFLGLMLYLFSSFFSGILIAFMGDESRLSNYTEGGYEYNSQISILSFYVLLKFLIIILNYIFWDKFSDQEKKYNFFVIVGFLFQMFFSSNGVLGWRFSEIFSFFDIFCLLMIFKYLAPMSRYIYIYCCILLTLLILYSTYFSQL
ncbi:EpsG family protein [Acinetobacter pittii]|uniref:EpsG family protein n=1 Tax=Acinetobacter pittii TaxID=48296 RepID=UPI00355C5DF3